MVCEAGSGSLMKGVAGRRSGRVVDMVGFEVRVR